MLVIFFFYQIPQIPNTKIACPACNKCNKSNRLKNENNATIIAYSKAGKTKDWPIISTTCT